MMHTLRIPGCSSDNSKICRLIGIFIFTLAAVSSAAELKYEVSWIGNSFGGKDAWVLQDVEDIFVDADGTLFTNVYWDEAGGNVEQYKDGKVQAIARHTHGWGHEGGDAVAANSKYLFIVQNVNNEGGNLKGDSWPPKGFSWSGISRRLRSDITKAAPFAGGHGKEGAVLQGSYLAVLEIPQSRRRDGGLRGVWATEDQLFVSSPGDDSIKVYDVQTMKLFRSWQVQRPDKICIDRTGECYSPQGACKWRVFGLHFIDCADLDPTSDTDLYTKEEHFELNYNKPAGQEWSYRGYTVNAFKYPDDPRLHIWSANPWVRRIDGKKFLFVSDMTGEYLQVYRFNSQTDGEVAIPCALFARKRANIPDGWPAHQPPKGEWIWRDRNGNGGIDDGEFESNGGQNSAGIYVPDERGSIWHVDGQQIRCLPIGGLDDDGVPVWSYKTARVWPTPPELDQVRRLHYLPQQDAMILGGNRGEDKNQHWKPMGPVLCCYDGWSGNARKLRWQTVLPYEKGTRGHESAEPISFDVAGEYVFVAYTRGLKADNLRWAFVKVLKLSDGSFVGNFSSESQLGEIGLLDMVESIRAARRSNGEYIVFMEDDLKSKVIMFRWRP